MFGHQFERNQLMKQGCTPSNRFLRGWWFFQLIVMLVPPYPTLPPPPENRASGFAGEFRVPELRGSSSSFIAS